MLISICIIFYIAEYSVFNAVKMFLNLIIFQCEEIWTPAHLRRRNMLQFLVDFRLYFLTSSVVKKYLQSS